MQFKVPQFIDIEDKVIGPLTFRQFAYLSGGAGFIYISFKILPFLFGLIAAAIFGSLAFALAFVKYNNKPFINVMQSFILFYSRSRLYLWRKEYPNVSKVRVPQKQVDTNRSQLTDSKLKTLSWSLDSINPQDKS